MNISSPTGFGKSYGALLVAHGMCGDWTKIAVIDSENHSADLYEHLGPYNVLSLSAPFTPEKYINAIKVCEAEGMEVIILDSITHVWKGQGGLLEYQNSLGGRYQDWVKTTPLYQGWLNSILNSSAHTITTCRKKQAYNIVTDGNRTKVEKAGLEDEIRDGYDYEMTLAFEIINDRHMVRASKDRTRLFAGQPEFVLSEETGKKIAEWCSKGIDIQQEIDQSISKLNNVESIDELRMFRDTLPAYILSDEKFIAAARERQRHLPLSTPTAQ